MNKRKIIEIFRKPFEWIKWFIEWEHFDRANKIICTGLTLLGLVGVGSSLCGNISIKGDDNQVEIGDKSDNRKISGNGNIIGNQNTFIQGDCNVKLDMPLDRLERGYLETIEQLKQYVDKRIEQPRSVKVVNQEPLLIKNPRGLDYVAQKAREHLIKAQYTNAVEMAHAAYSLIMAELRPTFEREQFHIEGAFIGNMERVYPVLIEEALANQDFALMDKYATEYSNLFQDFYPYAEALKTIASTRKEGRKLVFFSPETLRSLRKINKEKLYQYLSFLSRFGYLQPFELDYSTKTTREVDYSELFGLTNKLPYQVSYFIRAKTKEEIKISSNAICAQWCGFGRMEFVDIQLEASLAMGLPEEDRVVLPIKLSGQAESNNSRHFISSYMVETKLSWESKLGDNLVSNAYEVVFKDDCGEQILCHTNQTAFNSTEMVKIPEPSTSILLMLGLAILSLKRRRIFGQ